MVGVFDSTWRGRFARRCNAGRSEPFELPLARRRPAVLGIRSVAVIALIQTIGAAAALANNPPAFQNVTLSYGGGTQITVAGTVVDELPSGLTVSFETTRESTTTDANGDFSFTTSNAGLGTFEISTEDDMLQTAETSVEVTTDLDLIGFAAEVDPTNTLLVVGTVIDRDLASVTVEISFLGEIYHPTLDSNGNFSWSRSLGPDDEDFLNVEVHDAWTMTSETDYITPNP